MFENYIKNLLAKFETEYNPNDWSDFEKKYEKALRKNNFTKKLKTFSIGSAIIIATSILFVVLYNNHEKPNIDYPNGNEVTSSKNVSTSRDLGEDVINHSNHVQQTLPVTNVNNRIKQATKNNEETKPIFENQEQIIAETISEQRLPNIEVVPQQVNSISEYQMNLLIEPNKNVACAYEEIRFTPSIINNSFRYTWDFGDGNQSNDIFPVHIYRQEGNFDVKLSLKHGPDQNEVTSFFTITIFPVPHAQFSYEIHQENFGYPQVSFVDDSDGASQWKWSFGDSKFSYEQNPNHIYFIHENTTVNINLAIENSFGCKNEITKSIIFSNIFDLMAPNAFSPDGDGLNDYFIPRALEVMDISFEMFIYERGGNLIYNTKNKTQPWDGRIGNNGQIPDNGTFIWIVLIQDANGKIHKYAGNVSIIK
ncbi:MAG: PKD domain-containing protein [Bacteroidales bacterium]|nr:PKD domain-containing protein [Bacteroidales bacterium]